MNKKLHDEYLKTNAKKGMKKSSYRSWLEGRLLYEIVLNDELDHILKLHQKGSKA